MPTHKCMFQLSNENDLPLAQILGLPPPDRGDINSNCQWNTKQFGTLQMCKMPCKLMKSIYDIGRHSTPYCHNLRVEYGQEVCEVDPQLADLAQQHSYDDKALHIWKTPDGYLLTDKDTNVYALIHAKGFHFHDTNPKKCTGEGHMLIVAHPPGMQEPAQKFQAVLHNDVCDPNQISRVGSIEHSFRKIFSAVEYNQEPRVVYTSPMGQLVARLLKGQDAMAVKSCFVERAATEGPDVYHERLDLHPDLCQLLMLKSDSGNLRCVPCANGFIGYRIQKNDPSKRTLVLLANSSDTGGACMQVGSASNLQIFKFNYSNCNGPTRFIVRDSPLDCVDAFDISCTDTVQGILNRTEKVFRDMVNLGSQLHPFEIGANLTQNLAESSRFIDPNATSTETQQVLRQFLMGLMDPGAVAPA